MRVLITGATGLIGKHIVKQCKQQQVAVNYLTTRKEAIKKEKGYQGFLWDPSANFIDLDCFNEVTTIIHLAGASIAQRWTDENKEKIVASRINTAQLLFQTVKENPNQITHFISASAIGAYPSSKTETYTETYPTYNSGFLGDVVKAWEAAADQFKDLDIAVSKIRIGVVLAKNEGALPQLVKPIKCYVGAPLGDGKQWQSWIHIEDLASVFVYVLKQGLEGIYNAAAPNPITNEQLTKKSAQVLNKPLWLTNVPAFALKAILGEMAAIVLESQKVSSSKIEEKGFSFKYPIAQEALQDLLA